MLKNENLSVIQSEFDKKNSMLREWCEQVSPVSFYEDIFDSLDVTMPIVFIDDTSPTGRRMEKITIDEALISSANRNDTLMGGCTYYHDWLSKDTAKDIYAFIVDMDNVYSGVLLSALQDDWKNAFHEPMAKPTYIVNSGTGLHLYYVFDKPIPCYKRSLEDISLLYRELTRQQAKRIYVDRQEEWFGQCFRMAGGLNKYGWENTVFRYSDKWTSDKLTKAVGVNIPHISQYDEPKVKPEKKLKARKSIAKEGWASNRAFYDYTLKRCFFETHEGNRHMSMCALAVIAWKCRVSEAELEQDLINLLPSYNNNATRIMDFKDVKSAMRMYNPKATTTPKESLQAWLGWEYNPTKRNGRKRKDHIVVMNKMKEVKRLLGEEMNEGRPKGSGTAERKVREWRASHPDGTKSECNRDTGLSRVTIGKWWNSKAEPPKEMKKVEKYNRRLAIICRGCTMRGRDEIWEGYFSSNSEYCPNNSYLTFEEEPDNLNDPNAVKVVCRGEFFGTVGYVGREFTAGVKAMLRKNPKYRIEVYEEKKVAQREMRLFVEWKE